MRSTLNRLRVIACVFTSFAVFTSLLLCASIAAQSQKPPVFKGGVDLIQLDVSVLDKKGQPVKGLTAADFELFEDKVPQKIEAFSFVDLPDVVKEGPAWAGKVASDVVSNQFESDRIFVIYLDDALMMGNRASPLWPIREMRKHVNLFLDQLQPNDLVALVFSVQVRLNQNLTNDHAKIRAAVEAYPQMDGQISMPQSCLAPLYSVRTFEQLVSSLSTVNDRRKAIVYFGGNLVFHTKPMDECGVGVLWQKILLEAQQNHVTINPVDTIGLRPGSQAAADKYMSLADYTGGHAVVNNNDFAPGLRQILVENSSYYLLAYNPTNDAEDGRFRRITVKVNRPDVEVRTRSSYWAPKAGKPSEEPPMPPPPDLEAIAKIVPDATLPLRATAAAFAVPGEEGGVVAIAVGVEPPAFGQRTSEQLELLLKMYTADGDDRGSADELIPITVPAAAEGAKRSSYEVLARFAVPKPGKYELRLSAHSVTADSRGSVYVDVEVPDFGKEKVSLSGVIVSNALSSTPAAPTRLLRDVVPNVPTTERAFKKSDTVTAFLRVYQGGNDKLATVPVKVKIQDAAGKTAVESTETFEGTRFSADRSADFQFRLPLSTLTSGDYLVTFEAALGKTVARRDVRFQVR